MLGAHVPGDRIFQISPGNQPESLRAAAVALATARAQGGGWQPVIRHPWERLSYLSQTDSGVLDWVGYPTVLFNELLNLMRRMNEHYHQSTDLAATIDLHYAEAQARAAIETTIRWAEKQ
jgi:hypothetical protein